MNQSIAALWSHHFAIQRAPRCVAQSNGRLHCHHLDTALESDANDYCRVITSANLWLQRNIFLLACAMEHKAVNSDIIDRHSTDGFVLLVHKPVPAVACGHSSINIF